jgi:aspartate ammonia-lyase
MKDSDLETISNYFEYKEYKKDEVLFSENTERLKLTFICEGEVELFKTTPFGEEKRIAWFRQYDFLGEGVLFDQSAPHSTTARAITDTRTVVLFKENLSKLIEEYSNLSVILYRELSITMSRRIKHTNRRLINSAALYASGRTRSEHDLLGDRNVPVEHFFGIQTLRAMENFNISGVSLSFYPVIVEALTIIKKAAARANHELGLMPDNVAEAIDHACDEIMHGKYHKHFVVDMIQGGAGTSTNMNANEVIANVALEMMGHQKGEYQYCHPNNHVNLSQSTNDAYPSAVHLAIFKGNKSLVSVVQDLATSLRAKAEEFANIIKMGRTQLQDAVPMTLGQSFEAYATTIEEEIVRLNKISQYFLEVNMGATAIGTGINSEPEYRHKVVEHLREITGYDITGAENLVEATQDTSAFVMYSSALKHLAVKLSKISNDLRLLSSGPRCGLNEINLPPMQPGSSIMPGKVNPVIPEVVNQIAFKVIGNDLTVTMASEAGQLELNVMEPVIVQSIFESLEMLKNGMTVLKHRCIDGITANEEHIENMVHNSIGIVTALNPVLGYEKSTLVAKEALQTGKGVYDLVLEKEWLSQEQLDEILKPENMIAPRKFDK